MSLVLYIKQIKGNTDVLVSSWSLMLLQDLLFQLSISITQREKKRLKIRKNACAMSSFYINPYEQQQSHYPNLFAFYRSALSSIVDVVHTHVHISPCCDYLTDSCQWFMNMDD